MIDKRKLEHIEISLNKKVEYNQKTTLFEDIDFIHNALPETNFDSIDISVDFLGKTLKAPLIISALTGGTKELFEINKDLSSIAEEYKIGFGLGSQRIMDRFPEVTYTFDIRKYAPNIIILGNIGIQQAKEMSIEQISSLVEKIKGDALCIHLNPAMELIQPEGDRNFEGCYSAIEKIKNKLKYEIIIKETGCGISYNVGLKLKKIGIKFIDVGGSGGTSTVMIESYRNSGIYQKIGRLYSNWGIPTALSLFMLKDLGLELIATGGIRTGLDIAKAIALGAKLCGVALPVLKTYKTYGIKGVKEYIDYLIKGLKIAIALTGGKNLDDLKLNKLIITGKFREIIENLTK